MWFKYVIVVSRYKMARSILINQCRGIYCYTKIRGVLVGDNCLDAILKKNVNGIDKAHGRSPLLLGSVFLQ